MKMCEGVQRMLSRKEETERATAAVPAMLQASANLRNLVPASQLRSIDDNQTRMVGNTTISGQATAQAIVDHAKLETKKLNDKKSAELQQLLASSFDTSNKVINDLFITLDDNTENKNNSNNNGSSRNNNSNNKVNNNKPNNNTNNNNQHQHLQVESPPPPPYSTSTEDAEIGR